MTTLPGRRVRRFIHRFLDVLLPRTCAACRAIVDGEAPICAACSAALAASPVPESLQIPIRGPTLEPAMAPDRGPLAVRALFPYTAEARELVHALKYQGRRDVAGFLASVAAARHADELRDAILVPIPLHPRRERARGYNQSAVLAAAIAAATGARHSPALVRSRATRSQTRLGRGSRAGNVAGAFALAVPRLRVTAPVILVDDVVTTGATLSEAARVLSAAGVAHLRALTAAREL
jgi:ComF family protein